MKYCLEYRSRQFCFLFFLFFVSAIYGIPETNQINIDSISEALKADSLSALDKKRIAILDSIIKEQRLEEMNLRMDLENLRLQTFSADSLKRVKQEKLIDSLRLHTSGVPVIVSNDTLFLIFAKFAGHMPAQRAKMIEKVMSDLGKQYSLKPDSVYLETSETTTEIMYKNNVIATVSDRDGLWAKMSREDLAKYWKKQIVLELIILKKHNSILQLLKRIALFLLVIFVQFVLIKLTMRLYHKLKERIIRLKDSKLKPFKIRDYEILNTDKEVGIIVFLTSIGRYLLIFLQLLISIPILFSIFPQTKNLAMKLFSYIWDPFRKILKAIVDYIPNLFTIIIIFLVVHYLLRGIKYIADEIYAKRLKITGFYPDWAQPTYHILRFLMYAFMIAMIYPYLPGSNSKIFQGVSVFLGVIVSLGSSSVIGNIMAGLVITYMRPFKIGDRIKLNDVLGNVLEKTPFVTRLKTPKNEIVTIPNSFVMSSHTTNYSSSTRHFGLIIHTEVTIGYDAPWRQIHQLLIDSALATPGISKEPAPFVLETSLSDWYPVYQINAFITDADQQPKIMSVLLQNIQDHFNAAGVEIMSPHYIATRDGNESTIPKNGLSNGADLNSEEVPK